MTPRGRKTPTGATHAVHPPTPVHLTDAQRLDWLQLIRSENIGPRTFRSLLNHFGGAAAALDALPSLVKTTTGRAIVVADRAACAQEMEALAKIGASLIALGEADYPDSLRAIDAPPPLITVRGQLDLLKAPGVAIVGSRNASANGLALTDTLGRELGQAGYVVVSGLARGIDARAHRASLRTGTIGVLAGGFARIYPSENIELAEAIATDGVLISEMPINWEPRGRDFPRRNRLVSGLSLAVVVVEAARRSGSLITARFAQEQGREVFAVPGSPLDPRAEGTNDLLRQGASFCTGAADVIAAVAPMVEGGVTARPLLREDALWVEEVEPLWDEVDPFGSLPPPPQTLAGQEFDEAARTYQGKSLDEDAGLGRDTPQAQHPPPPTPAGDGSDMRTIRDGTSPPKPPDGGDLRAMVVNLLGPVPVTLDDLVRASGLSAAQLRAVVLDLEMASEIVRRSDTSITRIPHPPPDTPTL